MIKFYARGLYKTISTLNWEANQTYPKERKRGAYARLTEAELEKTKLLLDCSWGWFEKLEAPVGMDVVADLRARLTEVGLAEYRVCLLQIRNVLENECGRRAFAYIPQEQAPYFGLAQPFGARVAKHFPRANQEAEYASNSIAVDLPTAAVFHLMRCAELGMRVLARERRIKIKKVESLELAEWNQILQALDTEAEAVRNWKGRTKAKERALAFYSGASGELRGFKDEYRNHVSHTRTPYRPGAALDAFTKVKCFMQRLAAYLSEDTRKAICWTQTAHKPYRGKM